ncbi:hypothetical protein EDC26_12417 [Paralcaligenes ureilyticus]|uniref:Uncharacterized protein n=1 Tax=Paralcaligenes ureilyticus TaxID=627131 RepID=A0A4R3LME5_9BURK|nr:hypothetical protein EDC26_12417 [Paralcaligenes ureilyticus]
MIEWFYSITLVIILITNVIIRCKLVQICFWIDYALVCKWPVRFCLAAWALVDQGWVLSGPDGSRVDLTTGERAFLQTLFLTPDLRARRADLMDAIDISYAAAVGAGKGTRLGLLVSRMRRKFQARGVVLPLRAVHGFGYMFAGKIRPAAA